MSVGERISELRKQQNISQYQLAKLLDVSRQAVSKWENDLSSPDTLKLIHLADVLDTDVEYLATGKFSNHNPSPQVVTVVRNIDRVVEKVVEKPVYIEKIVEVEKPIETILEKTRIKKVFRTKYLRNPLEYLVIGVLSFLAGILIGLLL